MLAAYKDRVSGGDRGGGAEPTYLVIGTSVHRDIGKTKTCHGGAEIQRKDKNWPRMNAKNANRKQEESPQIYAEMRR